MRSRFPLFQSPLDVSHHYWRTCVKKGDTVIDCTSGNGHDTLFLASLALSEEGGVVYTMDYQDTALESTRKRLKEELPAYFSRVRFIQGCHSVFPQEIKEETVKLIVYNLGYLPGGDKEKTTMTATTLVSLQKALSLIVLGGVISVTCYPGHDEGAKEESALLAWSATLSPAEWSVSYQRWINRRASPTLLLLQRRQPDSKQSDG